MKLGRMIRERSIRGFAVRLIVAIGLPLGIVVGVLIATFTWWQTSRAGFRVDYFAKRRGTELIVSRTYRKALAYHLEGPPARGVSREAYFAVWRGFLLVPSTATYTFDSMSDDGIRVFIDDVLLLENWKNWGWRGSEKRSEIELEAGSHPIRIEHINRRGPSGLVLYWSGGEIPLRAIVGSPYVVKQIR